MQKPKNFDFEENLVKLANMNEPQRNDLSSTKLQNFSVHQSQYEAPQSGSINLGSKTPLKKQYKMSTKTQQKILKVEGKDLKFLTVNMLNINLREIKLTGNCIKALPDEIS